jgi:hypothetical protein
MAKRVRVAVVVDDATIAAGDFRTVTEPVWWSGDIENGSLMYERSLRLFSYPQRYVFAVRWYLYEVNNGGHRQFYSNSAGIVWQDALAGLEVMGLAKAAQILRVTADRMGGSPSLYRLERENQIGEHQPDFDDCDQAFYDFQQRVNIEEKLMDYIRANAADFHFAGTIEKVVLPNL